MYSSQIRVIKLPRSANVIISMGRKDPKYLVLTIALLNRPLIESRTDGLSD